MIRTLRTWPGDSRKPPSRSARLNLQTLEDRTVPAWLIHLSSGAGMAGDTAANIISGLAPNSALPTNAAGDTIVEAATAQDAIALALTGVVAAQVGSETLNYPMGPGSVGATAAEHKPFLYSGGVLALEDLASFAGGSDWDYNDHYWAVSAVEVPSGTGMGSGSGTTNSWDSGTGSGTGSSNGTGSGYGSGSGTGTFET